MIYGIILPIDELILFRMVKTINQSMLFDPPKKTPGFPTPLDGDYQTNHPLKVVIFFTAYFDEREARLSAVMRSSEKIGEAMTHGGEFHREDTLW